MHCHQIREAERLVYRTQKAPIPEAVLFPYPDPGVLGLKLEPREMAKIQRVMPGSAAERAELRSGDEIVAFAGQPLLSIADLQWVLHNAPASTRVPVQIRRDGKTWDTALELREGWRRGDISWRASTWDLRRMGLGGMKLDDLTDEQRRSANLPRDRLALRVRHLGEFGDHGVAMRSGVRKGDILIAFDRLSSRMSESEVLAYTLQRKRPGEDVTVTVLRDGERITLKYTLQ
jgi:S1-C subfamily serine protease